MQSLWVAYLPTIQTIDNGIFENAKITNVDITNANTMGKSIFKGSTIENIDFPALANHTIPESTFENTSSFTHIKIPASIRMIDNYAFKNASAFKGTSPSGLDISNIIQVNREAFQSTPIPYVYMPKVINLQEASFSNMSSLTMIAIPRDQANFAQVTAFHNDPNLMHIYFIGSTINQSPSTSAPIGTFSGSTPKNLYYYATNISHPVNFITHTHSSSRTRYRQWQGAYWGPWGSWSPPIYINPMTNPIIYAWENHSYSLADHQAPYNYNPTLLNPDSSPSSAAHTALSLENPTKIRYRPDPFIYDYRTYSVSYFYPNNSPPSMGSNIQIETQQFYYRYMNANSNYHMLITPPATTSITTSLATKLYY